MYLEKEAIDYFKNYDLKESFFTKFANSPEGFLSSRRIGSSAEFEEYKEYVPSDNLKDLDWKKFARTQKLLIKQYESYTHSKIYFVLDVSNSMNYPQKSLSKLEYAKKFIAIFSYLLIKNQNEVYLSVVGENLSSQLRITLKNIEQILSDINARGKFQYLNLLKIKTDGFVFLLSDGWWEKDFSSVINALVTNRINLIQILTIEELEFPYRDFFNFIDSETGSKIQLDVSDFSEIYKKRLTHRINTLYERFSKYNLLFYSMNDGIPYYHSLKNFLDIVV